MPAEQIEDQREHLLALFERRHPGAASDAPDQPIALAETITSHEKLVVLGDPGSGKTTLLRYLALKHAQALLHGQPDAGDDLGPARFPILVRIAEYAESGAWKTRSLSSYLADAFARHECPHAGLADLLQTALASGGCLILLDGLDEIVSADERRGVVRQIEDFVRLHNDTPNRFVISSRIAGYRSAPLGTSFAHYAVRDMDDEQIWRFLERWCRAVEDAQTPDSPPEVRAATAQREIDGILGAIQSSAGVRRLATNPLLLRTLALIHRTGGHLPQKRIELYKTAADTLART